MSFEFEALVGHLYVVGGRTISASPPGALCEVAPKTAARGRELDTLFTLVLPAEDSTAPAKFYEDLAQQAVRRYFESTGSVTAGLRDVFNRLNNTIYEQNRATDRKTTFEANIVLAVLRGRDLIVGRVGGAVVLIGQHGRMQTFPPDLSDDDALYTAPMGVHPVPNVRMTQYQVETATRVIFGDSSLADLVHDQMAAAMQSMDLGTVLVAFQELARLHMQILAFEFAPLESTTAAYMPVGTSTKQVSAQVRAAARSTGEQAAVKPGKDRKPRRRRGKEVQRRAKRGVGQAATGLGGGLTVIQRMIDHFFAPQGDNERGFFGTTLGASSVVLLPIAVVGLVVMLWLSGTGETEFEICLQEAQDNAALARTVATQDRITVQNAWDLTLRKVDECQDLRPNDPDLANIEREGQTTLDTLNNITRRDATAVASMPSADLTDIVVQGTAMYVLDGANAQVYRVTLTADGLAAARAPEPIGDMRRGGRAAGSIPIEGDIIGVAYNTFRNVFVAISTDGVLIECRPDFSSFCAARRLQGTELWVNPIEIEVWSNNIYILDPGAEQIWRYEPSGTAADAYINAPEEYFGATVDKPPMLSAVDFVIDNDGIVYVLLSEGTVFRYRGGVAEPFAYTTFITGQEINSATSMFIDTRVTEQVLHIVQADRGAVYELSYVGTYRNQFRATEPDNFAALEKVAAAPSGDGQRDMIYALSGNTVFAMIKRG